MSCLTPLYTNIYSLLSLKMRVIKEERRIGTMYLTCFPIFYLVLIVLFTNCWNIFSNLLDCILRYWSSLQERYVLLGMFLIQGIEFFIVEFLKSLSIKRVFMFISKPLWLILIIDLRQLSRMITSWIWVENLAHTKSFN